MLITLLRMKALCLVELAISVDDVFSLGGGLFEVCLCLHNIAYTLKYTIHISNQPFENTDSFENESILPCLAISADILFSLK